MRYLLVTAAALALSTVCVLADVDSYGPPSIIIGTTPVVGCGTTSTPVTNNSGVAGCAAGGQIPSMANGRAPSTILVSTASQTINTTSETSCFSATSQGPGQTITGGVPYVGNRFHLHCSGIVTTPIGGGTVALKVKWGSTSVASVSGLALLISLTNQPWELDAYCTMRTVSGTPSSSTMVCQGLFIGVTTLPTVFISASPVTIDTTASQVLDMTFTWTSVAGSQTATGIEGVMEILW